MFQPDRISNGGYITSSDAASLYRCSKDYISRLCRAGTLSGYLVGRNWFIESESFDAFLAQKDGTRAGVIRKLVEVRKQEYAQAQNMREPLAARPADEASQEIALEQGSFKKVGPEHSRKSSYSVRAPKDPVVAFYQKAAALVLSIGVVFSAYELTSSSYPRGAASAIKEAMHGAYSAATDTSYLAASLQGLTSARSDFFGKQPDVTSSLFKRALDRVTRSFSTAFNFFPTPISTVELPLAALPKRPLSDPQPSASPISPVRTIVEYRTVQSPPLQLQPVQPATDIVAASSNSVASISKHYVDDQIQILRNSFSSEIFKYSSAQFPNAPGISQYTANLAVSQRIDQLGNVSITNATVHGVSGLTAADIPTDITARNYLPLSGGSLSGDLTIAGNFNVSGSEMLTGAITVPYLIATSTTVSSSFAGLVGIGTSTPSSAFSVQGNSYTSGTSFFGGAITATSTLNISGNATLSSTLGVTGLSTLTGGFLSAASSTVVGNFTNTGNTAVGGTLNVTGNTTLASATSSAFAVTNLTPGSLIKAATGGALIPAAAGTDFVTPARAVSTTYPLQGGGDLSADRTLTLAFGTTTQNVWSAFNSFASLFASNASTTNATTTNLHITSLASSGLGVDPNGRVYAAATTTAGMGLSYGSGAFNVNTAQNITTLSNLSTAGTVSNTGSGSLYSTGTSTPSVTAPITYSGTLGQFVNGVSGAFGCTNASAGATGCLTGADWSTFNNKQPTISTTWPITLTGATVGFGGLSTTTAAVVGNIPYFSGVGTFANVATSAPSIGSVVTYSGTLGSFVGGSSGTFGIANTSITNAMLAGSIAASKLTGTDIATVGTITSGTWSGLFGTVSGANLTSLTAANITGSHTLPDSVLSTNVPLLNTANAFTNAGNTTFVGNVGVGTTNPTEVNSSARLTVAGAGSQLVVASTTDNTTSSVGGFAAFANTTNFQMLAHASSRVVSRYGLTLGGWNELTSFNNPAGTSNGLVIGVQAASPVVFGTNNLERMRIDSAGLVGIGTTSPTHLLDIAGSDATAYVVTANPTTRLTLQNTNTTNNTFADFSLLTNDTNGLNVTGSRIASIFTSHTPGAVSADLAFVNRNAGTLTEAMRITSGGSVGIGTTSPQQLLHLGTGAGTNADRFVRFSNGQNPVGADIGISSGAGGLYILTRDAQPLNFGTNNTTGRMVLDSSGNVGIGNTAPSNLLTVTGTTTGAYAPLVKIGNAGDNRYVKIGVYLSSDGNQRSYLQSYHTSSDANPWDFLLNPAGGNVGIGTTTPLAGFKLDVNGTIGSIIPGAGGTYLSNGAGYGILASIDAGNNLNQPLAIQPNGGNVGIGTTNPTNGKLEVSGNIATTPSASNVFLGSNFISNLGGALSNFGGTAGGFYFVPSGNGAMSFVTVGADRVRIDSSGNVGIGTVSPTTRLHVTDAVGNAGTIQLGATASTGYYAKVAHSANEFRLDANGDTDYRASVATNNGSGYLTFFTGAGTALGGTNASTEKMRITYAGNVGIGTTSPVSKFTVVDTANGNNLWVESNNNNASLVLNNTQSGVINKWQVAATGGSAAVPTSFTISDNTTSITPFVINSSGNVGIGTTSPIATLSVNGPIALGSNGGIYGPSIYNGSGTLTIPGGTGGIQFNNQANNASLVSILNGGNVGIGTTTPNTKFEVVGGATFDTARFTNSANPGIYINSTSATDYKGTISFAQSGTLKMQIGTDLNGAGDHNFFVYDSVSSATRMTIGSTGNMTVFGSGTTCVIGSGTGATNCTSDARLKTNIVAITGEEALQKLALIRGVTFNWLDPSKDQEQRVGVIAQDVQAAFPQVVGHATTTLGGVEGSYLTVDYAALVAPLISAVNELFSKVNALASVVAGFADSFTTKHVHTDDVQAQKICLGSTCITEAELKAVLADRNIATSTGAGATTTPDTIGPVITLNGANPAHIDIGATYIDLGATVTDNVDQNLGYKVSLDGATSTDPSALVLDTSTSTTHIITYSATDQAGNGGLTTRTVIVGVGE